jgi:hypothetical protein
MRLRLLVGAALAATAALAPPSTAASLTLQRQPVHWTGTLSSPDLTGCDRLSQCDEHDLTVVAPKGTWITVRVSDDNAYVAVRHDGFTVGANGSPAPASTRSSGGVTRPVTTFQQVASGRVGYQVLVGSSFASPALPTTYQGEASLSGRAFDREGDCGLVDPGLQSALSAADDGSLLHLSVRFVADPRNAAVLRPAARALVETYARIGVAVRVSFDVMRLTDDGTYPFVQVRRRYGGVRPHGVDAVHVLSDDFEGGYAECIGGVAYPERGFSNGSAHYAFNGVPVDRVPAGMIAAHEIGHQLGAHHEMVSCVEAAPQLLLKPASDGSAGPCTVMGPLALQDSETFSTAERATVRSFVRRWAGRW